MGKDIQNEASIKYPNCASSSKFSVADYSTEISGFRPEKIPENTLNAGELFPVIIELLGIITTDSPRKLPVVASKESRLLYTALTSVANWGNRSLAGCTVF